MEREPNELDPTKAHLAQVAFYLDAVLHVVQNLFNKNPPKFDRTIEDLVIKFGTEKPAVPGKKVFRPPVIRNGKVVDPGSEGEFAPAGRDEPRRPRRADLSPEQEREAREAISRAAWGALAGTVKVMSAADGQYLGGR